MLCVWLWSGSHASAQSVALDMSACPEPPARDVRSVLAVELHEQLVGEADVVPPAAMIVEVRCSGGRADVWLRGTNSRRTVALTSVPVELRARLLALSVAELTRPQPSAASGELAGRSAAEAAKGSSPVGRAEPERETVAEEPRAAEADARSEDDALEFEDSSAPDTTLGWAVPGYVAWAGVEANAAPLFGWGGAVSFRARVARHLAWSSTLGAGYATTDIDRGKLRVWSGSLRSGLAWLLESSRASLHVGAGIRGRWQRLKGSPSDAESTAAANFEAWSVGPALFAGATWRVAQPLFIALELEGDHMLREVRARVEGGDTKTLSPWRLSATLGAGIAW